MRWLWFLFCAVLGLALLACGLLVPMHLRAVDASILAKGRPERPRVAGRGTRRWRVNRRLGTAQMLMQAARLAGISRLGPARPD